VLGLITHEDTFEFRDEIDRHVYNRQMRMRNPHRFRRGLRKELIQQHGGCRICGSTHKLSLDHLIPVAKGGTGSDDNAILLCQSCNSQKHERSLEEYLGHIERKASRRDVRSEDPDDHYWQDSREQARRILEPLRRLVEELRGE